MSDDGIGPEKPAGTLWSRTSSFLALERNVLAVSAAMLLLALGENLWRKFLPKYLQALGAPIRAIGFFGSVEDFLDGVYQYPGGWLGDRLGRRNALLGFVSLAGIGYAIYRVAPTWQWAIAGLFFVQAWTSMGSPALFAVIGDALPKERRAMGFTVQAVLKRVPIAIAPMLGGMWIAREGLIRGMHSLLVVTIFLAVVAMLFLSRVAIPRTAGAPTNILGVWRSFERPLRWLLISDIFIRTSDALVDVFLVIYATTVVGVSLPHYALLVMIQATTSIVIQVPAARIADRIGRKPFVIATFVAFSLFPLGVVLAKSFAMLIVAFVIGGLREIGEPSRKALIVDSAQPEIRARSIGLYYLIRSVAIAPAAFIGGVLWETTPAMPFFVAFGMGIIGTFLFTITVKEEHA
jgi:MFS family permease